jgi:predicted small secreted protein
LLGLEHPCLGTTNLRRSEMKRIVYAVLVAMTLAACNTMSGLGEDIQRGGQKLENAAEKNKK